jgi:4-hydroxybenzoyl-CoA thioesterase
MIYERQIQIEFNHCDPAGIVFYPRYFEMTNSVVENFFADVVGRSFASMHLEGRQRGVPTVRIEADFIAPAQLGEVLGFALRISKLGRSSMSLRIEGEAAGSVRLRADLTIVWVENLRATPWPDEMRARLSAYEESQDA